MLATAKYDLLTFNFIRPNNAYNVRLLEVGAVNLSLHVCRDDWRYSVNTSLFLNGLTSARTITAIMNAAMRVN